MVSSTLSGPPILENAAVFTVVLGDHIELHQQLPDDFEAVRE
jgi:hypothetical protein